jgi:hypothetical protein
VARVGCPTLSDLSDPPAVSNPPEAPESADDLFAGMERELEAEFPDPRLRKAFIGMMRGMASLRETAGGRAFLEMVNKLTPEEREGLGNPIFKAEMRERYARFYESAPDDQIIKIALDSGLGPKFSKRELISLVGRAARRRTARGFRNQIMEGVEPGKEVAKRPRGVDLPPLTPAERAQAGRAARFALPRIFAAKEELKAGNLTEGFELFAEAIVPGPALLLRPPPSGEPYGKKNRSEIYLPSDRKPCNWAGCRGRCTNAGHFCPKHAAEAKRTKDTAKKARRYAKSALAREQSHAAPGGVGLATNADGTLSGEMESGPDLATVRRKLQGR